MSGFTLGNEFTTNLPEKDQIEAQKQANTTSLKYFNSMLSQPLSWLAPDPRLTEITGGPHALNYVPYVGAVEQTAGLGASIIDALGTVRNAITGRQDDWKLPGMETARKMGEHAEKTREEIRNDIAKVLPLPAADTTKEIDDLTDEAASLTGMGLPAVPKAAARFLTENAPRGTKFITHLLTPSTENVPEQLVHAGTAAPLFTGVNEAGIAYDEAQDKAQDVGITPPTTTTHGGLTVPTADVTTQPAEPIAPVNAPPDQVAAVAPPRGTATDAPTVMDLGITAPTQTTRAGGTTPDGVVDLGLTDKQTEVPMQQEQGVGNMGVGQALATLLGAGAMIHGARRLRARNAAVTEAGRQARMNDPAYAAAVQDYKNAEIAKGQGAISQGTGQATEAPISMANPLRTGLNRANTAVLDRTARGQEIIRDVATPTTAESLAHEYGLIHDDGYHGTRFDAFLDTGYHPQTGVQIPVPDRQYRAISRLEEPRQVVLMEGLGAANEQDNRKNNRTEFAKNNPGQTPTDADIRHDFKNADDIVLQQRVDAMMNDPQLRQLAENHWAIEKGMREIANKMGVLPTAERTTLDAAHPHHVSETDSSGKVMRPLSQRDRTLFTGVEQMNSKPWFAQSQAIEDLHKEFEQRQFNAKLYNSIMEAQNRYPQMAKLIEDTAPPTDKPVYYSGGNAREEKHAIHTAHGTKWIKINNADVANMFTNDSLRRSYIKSEAATIPRRLYQNFTTGVGALASGSVAALRNVGYTIPAMSINAPKGFHGGLIHRGVNTLTGGRWDSGVARGLDMLTNPATVAYAYGRGVIDRRVHNVANLLERGSRNPVNTMLRSRLGDLAVENMQRALDKYYQDSVTYEIQAKRGIGGGGYGPKTELQPLGYASDKRASITAARHVPFLFHSGGEWMGVKPVTIRLHNALVDALSHLSDAGHDAFYRLNRDNPRLTTEQLSYETRALTGNPTTSGSSRVLKTVTDLLPFTNISLQGGARALRSVGERPLNSVMAMATGLGTLKLLSLMTAMQSPQTMQNYQQELSTQEHSGNIIIYLPNGKPWMIPLAQEFQIPATLVESLVANAMNVVAMQHDPLTFQSAFKMLTDFFSGHISTAMTNQLKYDAANQVSPFMGIPLVGQFDPYKMMQGDSMWQSFRGTFDSGPAAATRTLPNQTPDTLLEGTEGKGWTKVIGATLGLAGTAIMEHVNALGPYLHQFGNWADALGQTGHDWVQRAGDRNRVIPPLMDREMRLSLMPPIIEQTERELRWMKNIKGSRTEPIAEGTTGRGRTALPVYTDSSESKIPDNPTMNYLWRTIESANKRVAPQLAEIGAMRKQMDSVSAHGMNVEQRRAWMNDATRRLADKYRYIHDVVEDTNQAMSRVVGRNVRVGMHIDWKKGPEQFTE